MESGLPLCFSYHCLWLNSGDDLCVCNQSSTSSGSLCAESQHSKVAQATVGDATSVSELFVSVSFATLSFAVLLLASEVLLISSRISNNCCLFMTLADPVGPLAACTASTVLASAALVSSKSAFWRHTSPPPEACRTDRQLTCQMSIIFPRNCCCSWVCQYIYNN